VARLPPAIYADSGEEHHMRLLVMSFVAALFLAFPGSAQAAGDAKGGEAKAGGSGKYLVTATHTPEECLASMDEVAKNKKLLEKAEWGCMSGDHTVYLTMQAKSPDDAIKQLPEHERKNAKAVKLTKLTAAQIKKFHEQAAMEKGGTEKGGMEKGGMEKGGMEKAR
jgi:hypothetical protein